MVAGRYYQSPNTFSSIINEKRWRNKTHKYKKIMYNLTMRFVILSACILESITQLNSHGWFIYVHLYTHTHTHTHTHK